MKNVPDTRVVALNDYHAPAADTPAVVTIPADADEAWVIYEIIVSLDVTSDVLKLNVTFGGVEKFAVDIPAAGVYPITFRHGLTRAGTSTVASPSKNEAVVVTLAADTGGSSGSVNVVYA